MVVVTSIAGKAGHTGINYYYIYALKAAPVLRYRQ